MGHNTNQRIISGEYPFPDRHNVHTVDLFRDRHAAYTQNMIRVVKRRDRAGFLIECHGYSGVRIQSIDRSGPRGRPGRYRLHHMRHGFGYPIRCRSGCLSRLCCAFASRTGQHRPARLGYEQRRRQNGRE